ncbi:hypothetical protein JCM10914A_25290 [Paenibacillus sp. JCM 10914]|uniref:hypothetical protein n=1 Tax=Paenibacillus sp. JCM 10914 TaxID=1236974 RepID=UPI0003CCA734|nr:hypothetical protein [Paenibacillus sp. JCM 10914]GAE09019.1 hypothetical protein JCM10914_5360 [Paenibacillus sp. JCM 10914]
MKKYGLQLLKICLASSLLLLSSFSMYPPGPAEAKSSQKATWFWETPLIKDSTPEILEFANSQGINVFYLQMNRDVRPEYYRDFIRKAGRQGIEVHVLGGAPNWALESERHRLETFIEWTAEYQAAAAPNERFTGIHVDIEPHVLGEWRTNYDSVVRQWQNNVRYLVDGARSLNLPIASDMTFWLHTYKLPDQSASLSSWMIQQFDQIVIMAYRDSAQQIYNLAAAELAEADKYGKEALIAVETKSSNEGNYVTFYEEGTAFMEQELGKVNKLAAKHASFSGIAIHEYRAWKELHDLDR